MLWVFDVFPEFAGWWLQVSATRRFNTLHGKCPAVFWDAFPEMVHLNTANIHPEFSSASRCFSSTKRSFPGFQTRFVFLANKRVGLSKKSFKHHKSSHFGKPRCDANAGRRPTSQLRYQKWRKICYLTSWIIAFISLSLSYTHFRYVGVPIVLKHTIPLCFFKEMSRGWNPSVF